MQIMCVREHGSGTTEDNLVAIGYGDPLAHYASCPWVAPWIRTWARTRTVDRDPAATSRRG